MELKNLYPVYSIASLCRVISGSLNGGCSFKNLISTENKLVDYQKIFYNLLPEDVTNNYYHTIGSERIATGNLYSLLRDGKKNAGKLGNILYKFMEKEENINIFRKHLLNIINENMTDGQMDYIRKECIDKIFFGRKLLYDDGFIYVTQNDFFNILDTRIIGRNYIAADSLDYNIDDNVNANSSKISELKEDFAETDVLSDLMLSKIFLGCGNVNIKLLKQNKSTYKYKLTFDKSNKRESDLDCNISLIDTYYANRYKAIKNNDEAIADIIMCSFCIGRIEQYIDKLIPYIEIDERTDKELQQHKNISIKIPFDDRVDIGTEDNKEYSEQELFDKIKSSYLNDGNVDETVKFIKLLWKKNNNFWKHNRSLCLVNYFIVHILHENIEQFTELFNETKLGGKRLEENLLIECYKYCRNNFEIADVENQADTLWGQTCFELAYSIYYKRIVDIQYSIGEILEMAASCNCPERLICQLKGDMLLDDDYYEKVIRDNNISNHLNDYGDIELNRKVAACFEYLNINASKEYWKLGVKQLNSIFSLYPDYEITQCIHEGLKNKNLARGNELQISESIINDKQTIKEVYYVLLKAENYEVVNRYDKSNNKDESADSTITNINERFVVFGYNKKVSSFLSSIQDMQGQIDLYVTEAEKELYCKEEKEKVNINTNFTIKEVLAELPIYCWDKKKPNGYQFGNSKIHFIFLGDDRDFNIKAVAEIIEETYKKECVFNDVIAAMETGQKCIFADGVDIVLDNDGHNDRMYLDSVLTRCNNFYLPIRYLSYNEELSHDLLYRIPLFRCNQKHGKDRQDIVILGNSSAIYPLVKNILSVAMFGRSETYKGDSSMMESFLSTKLSITILDKNAESIQNRLKYEFSEIYMEQPYEKIEPSCYVIDVESYGFFEFFRNSVDKYTENSADRRNQKEIWQVLRKANYFICALSNGKKNIDLSFRLRSEILKRDIQFARKPIIAALCDEVVYSLNINEFAVGNTKSSSEWYLDWDIDTFGELSRYYTYGNFYNNLADKLALNIHMSYYEKNEEHAAKCSYYNSNYNYSSSIAAALYIPYRLYSAGTLDCTGALDNFSFCESQLRKVIDIAGGKVFDADTKECLAIEEHARWNLYMALQGYSPATKAQVASWLSKGFINHQFHLARLHPYIASWSKLGERNYSKVHFGHNETDMFVKIWEKLEEIHNRMEEYATEKISILMDYGFASKDYFSEDNDKLFVMGMMPKESEYMFTKYLNSYSGIIKILVDFEDKILDLYKFYDKKYHEMRDIIFKETNEGEEIKQGKELFDAIRQIANLRANYNAVFQEKYGRLEKSKNMFFDLVKEKEESVFSYYNALTDSESEEYKAYNGFRKLLQLSYGGGFSPSTNAFLVKKFIDPSANNKSGIYLRKIGEDLLVFMQICTNAMDFESDGIQKWMLQYQKFNHLQLSKYSIKQIDRDMIDNIWNILKNTLEIHKDKELTTLHGEPWRF